MELPKFLMCYNSSIEDKAYVLHTDYPKFMVEIPSEEVEMIDIPEENEDNAEILNEITDLVTQALDFFDQENRLID